MPSADPKQAWAQLIREARISADILFSAYPGSSGAGLSAFAEDGGGLKRRCVLGAPKAIVGHPEWSDRREGWINAAKISIEGWGWPVKVVDYQPTMDCLIVDSSRVLLSNLVQAKDGRGQKPVLLTTDPHTLRTIAEFFDTLWVTSTASEVLYEDLLSSSIPNVEAQVVVASNELWGDLIAMLAKDPDQLQSLSPRRFEELVAELLSREGLRVELTQQSRDGGRDILAWASTLAGPHLYLVECKRYRPPRPVGVSIVRALYGSVVAEQATGGLLITTSRFTRDARLFQSTAQHRIWLKDSLDLKMWLKNHSGI